MRVMACADMQLPSPHRQKKSTKFVLKRKYFKIIIPQVFKLQLRENRGSGEEGVRKEILLRNLRTEECNVQTERVHDVPGSWSRS